MAGLIVLFARPGQDRGKAPTQASVARPVENPRRHGLIVLLASCILWLPLASQAADSPIIVSDPWVREGPPSARVLAAYMGIGNRSAQPIHLLGMSSPHFEKIELHRTEIVDGVARMSEVEKLTIQAGEQIELEPGGLHAMLYRPVRTLREGEQIPLQLRFEDGTLLSVTARVRKAPGAAEMHHRH